MHQQCYFLWVAYWVLYSNLVTQIWSQHLKWLWNILEVVFYRSTFMVKSVLKYYLQHFLEGLLGFASAWFCTFFFKTIRKWQQPYFGDVMSLPFDAAWFQLLTASFGKPEIDSLNFLNWFCIWTEFSSAFKKKTGLLVNTTVIYKSHISKLKD